MIVVSHPKLGALTNGRILMGLNPIGMQGLRPVLE